MIAFLSATNKLSLLIISFAFSKSRSFIDLETTIFKSPIVLAILSSILSALAIFVAPKYDNLSFNSTNSGKTTF